MATTYTVRRTKGGASDIYFGTGTFERLSQDGSTLLTVEKVSSDHLPVVDNLDIFDHDYLTGVLEQLYELYTDAHIQTWFYQDENGTILHGMGDVLNQPADREAGVSFYKKDANGTVIHGMGDIPEWF